MIFFNQKVHGLTWPELVELGAPKMAGQFLALGPMSNSINKLKKGLCGNVNSSMLDYTTSSCLCYIYWIDMAS